MSKFILAGVGTVQLFDPSNGELIVSSKTLTESGVTFSISEEEIRGGLANAKLGSYFHDSAMKLKLTDALFNLQYLALTTGSTITMGTDVMTQEQVTLTVANKVTVSQTPQDFAGLGTIGWISESGKDSWSKIEFDADTKTANVDFAKGSTVCVKYIKNDASSELFTVNSDFIPSQCYALLTLPLFKAGTENVTTYTSSSKVGEVQVEIPNFIVGVEGQELSLTASGSATTSLSGSACVTFTGNEGCNDSGYYAKLKQITYNKDEFADVKSIVIADSDIDLASEETQNIKVYAIYGGIVAPKLIDNSKITFTSSETSVATVDVNGTVTAVSSGESIVECVVTNKPSLVAKAVVTVE